MEKLKCHQYQHIILISLDSLRNDCITAISSDFPDKFIGHGKLKTEMLNYVISRGTYFINCISAAPYTSASHAAYFTGCWPKRNGVYEFFNRQLGLPTIFELAKKAGMYTIFQTDFPIILGESVGFTRGVDKYFVESEGDAFLELLKNQHRSTVSFFHFGGIHYPYGFHKLKFAETDFPKKVFELENKFNIHYSKNSKKHPDMLDESYRSKKDKNFLLRYKAIIDALWTQGRYNDLHKLYIEGIDYFLKHRFNPFIKKIIDFVDKNDSLLVLFADHGESWSLDSRGHSNSIDDVVLRVPVILYGKGVAKNTVVSKLIRTIDIFPTICQYSKIARTNFDGEPINLMNPNNSIGSREAFAQVWRVGDRNKVYQHQQHIIKDKKMIKPLSTKLEKEAAYHDGFAINREYDVDGRLIKEILFKNTGKCLVTIDKKYGDITHLINLLKKYNRIRCYKNHKINNLKRSIVDDLKVLGYHI
ncbi:MAG: sulfatase-like hydrolase/transferase [Candidatus Pacebacteria bacterium]|nr:sulfatase-like hydrolase/transferase [Candidatus Paceibacterota bacterium]